MEDASHVDDFFDEDIPQTVLENAPVTAVDTDIHSDVFLFGDELSHSVLHDTETEISFNDDHFGQSIHVEESQLSKCFDSIDHEDDIDESVEQDDNELFDKAASKADKAYVSDAYSSYLRIISKFEIPTREEQFQKSCQVLDGDRKAFEWMFNHNLRLVVGHARTSARLSKMDIMDLISHGNIGLWRAVEKFNPHLGYQFSTYATPWIRQALYRAVSQEGTTIRVPYSVMINTWKKNRLDRETAKTGQRLSDSDMCDTLGVSKCDLENIIFLQTQRHLSYDGAGIGNDEKSFAETLAYDECESNTYIEQKHMQDMVSTLLKSMPPKHIKVLQMRFGLNGDSGMTLDEVGNELGVTRERVRQIENEALRKMRVKMLRLNIQRDDLI